MRKFQPVLSKGLEINLPKIGKICLFLLITVMTVLLYSKAEAKEEKQNKSQRKTDENYCQLFQNTEEEKVDANEVFKKIDEETSIKEEEKAKEKKAEKEKANTKVETDQKCEAPKVLIVDEDLREDVKKELEGTKMESMIDAIASRDRETAALLVGIAKIESGYSHNYSYNFWGYAGGYYAFSSPEQAVDVVGNRIDQLRSQGINTPSEMVTPWKCGRSCASHSNESVQRWVGTVSGPYNRIAMK